MLFLDELCQCPQKCDERVPIDARERLFAFFYGLGEADLQNQFLRQNMDLRARLNIPETTGTGRPPRRITCKYLVPLLPGSETVEVCQKAFVSAFVITTKRVRLQREKLISSLGLNSYSSHSRGGAAKPSQGDGQKGAAAATPLALKVPSSCEFVERPNTEPKTPEMPPADKPAVKRLVDNPLIPLGLLLPDGVTIAPVTATPDHDRDIAIVNNFFSNQLWKPEYIGTYS